MDDDFDLEAMVFPPPTCGVAGCRGETTPPADRCLGHLDDARFQAEVARLKKASDPVAARGAQISAVRVHALILSIVGTTIHTLHRSVDLRGATIDGDLELSSFTLTAGLDLTGATVAGHLKLRDLMGLRHLRLAERTTVSQLTITGCGDKDDELSIRGIEVQDVTRIDRTDVRSLKIEDSHLGTYFVIADCTTAATLDVRGCSCSWAQWEHLRIAGGATLTDLWINRWELQSCHFESWTDLFVAGSIEASRCSFAGPARVRWLAPAFRRFGRGPSGPSLSATIESPAEEGAHLELESVRFESAAHLLWGRGHVRLPATLFSSASTLDQGPGATGPPRLTDVVELDGAKLRMGAIDLTGCRLSAAATLGPVEASRLCSGSGRAGLTRRSFIAEEADEPRAMWSPDQAERARRRATAQTLSETYRDLRTSSEAVGNFSGANDLYYGERLWQRRASVPGSVQWCWLTAYALVGFGVRPWRPLALLALMVVVATVAFGGADGLTRQRTVRGTPTEALATLCGRDAAPRTPSERQDVRCPASFADRLEFSVRTSTTVIRPVAGFDTRHAGTAIEIMLRLSAALLFGLFVLAVRSRVHR